MQSPLSISSRRLPREESRRGSAGFAPVSVKRNLGGGVVQSISSRHLPRQDLRKWDLADLKVPPPVCSGVFHMGIGGEAPRLRVVDLFRTHVAYYRYVRDLRRPAFSADGQIDLSGIKDVEVLEDGMLLNLRNGARVSLRPGPGKQADVSTWATQFELYIPNPELPGTSMPRSPTLEEEDAVEEEGVAPSEHGTLVLIELCENGVLAGNRFVELLPDSVNCYRCAPNDAGPDGEMERCVDLQEAEEISYDSDAETFELRFNDGVTVAFRNLGPHGDVITRWLRELDPESRDEW